MPKSKINLGEIKVQSFTTTLAKPQDYKGGGTQNVGCAYNSLHPEICNTNQCSQIFWCELTVEWWCAHSQPG